MSPDKAEANIYIEREMRLQKAARIAENAEALYHALRSLMSIVTSSEGVVGWHADKTVAKWNSFHSIGTARAVLRRIER